MSAAEENKSQRDCHARGLSQSGSPNCSLLNRGNSLAGEFGRANLIVIAGVLLALLSVCVRISEPHDIYVYPAAQTPIERIPVGELLPKAPTIGREVTESTVGRMRVYSELEQVLAARIPVPRSGDRRSVVCRILSKLCRSGPDEVSCRAVIALAKIQDLDSEDLVAKAFRSGSISPQVSERALIGMGLCAAESAESSSLLVRGLRSTSRKSRERELSAIGLGLSGDARVLPEILKQLARMRTSGVLAFASGLFESPVAGPEIRHCLMEADSAADRMMALAALGRVGGADCATAVLRSFRSNDHILARQAVLTLGRISGVTEGKLTATIVLVAKNHKQLSVRRLAVRALGWSPCDRAIDCLRETVTDANAGLAVESVDALSRIAGPGSSGAVRSRAIEILRTLAEEDRRPEVWSSACVALGVASDASAKPTILARFRSETTIDYRARAALALGLLAEEPPVREMEELFERARKADAVLDYSLALRLCEDEAIDALLVSRARKARSEYDRVLCVRAMGAVRSLESVEFLTELLLNERRPDSLRAAAAQALGDIFDRRGRRARSRMAVGTDLDQVSGIVGEVFSWL